MDPNFYVWCLRWWPYAIGHGLNPLVTHLIGAPGGDSLAWVTTVPPLALLAAPLTLAAGPVVAFNLLAAIGLPLAAWAAFVLCRRLTGKFWASLAGGAVFGFSAYQMNHDAAGQLNLTYSLLMPILAYLIVVWWDGGMRTPTFVALAAVTMAVQFYLFLETFADMTAILAVSLLLAAALTGRAWRSRILRLARLTGIAYAIALLLAVPYLAYALTTRAPKLVGIGGVDLASLVIPRQGRTYGIGWLAHDAAGPLKMSAAGYIGVPLLVLVLLLAVTSWSSRLVRFLSGMLVFIVIAALGPDLYLEGHRLGALPWGLVWRLPILRNAYPSRLMLFAFVILAVATALWLAGSRRAGASPGTGRAWRTWARWALAALVIAFVALDTPAIPGGDHTTVPTFISSGQYRRDLSRGEIVVVVSGVGNAGMLWQAESAFYLRLAGGFINAGLSHRTDLPEAVQDLAHATPRAVTAFEAYIRADHIGAILLDTSREPRWVGIFWRVGLHGHLLGQVIVYPTDGCRACRQLSQSQIGRAAPA